VNSSYKFSLYFIIIFAFSISFTANASEKYGYILPDGVPINFDFELKSVESSNTVIGVFKGQDIHLELLKRAGLTSNNYGKVSKDDILIRIHIAGSPSVKLTKKDKNSILNNIKSGLYELTCYRVYSMDIKSSMPVCSALSKLDKQNIIQQLNISIDKYLPLDYSYINDINYLVKDLKKMEQHMIMNKFM
jgi:hypothetical protein